jgi:hypothetical protein
MESVMKDAEDEAFDELAKRQGHWGGGFMAKKAMAADKLQEPVTIVTSESGNPDITMSWWHEPPLPVGTPLYTYPPKRPWIGLTDEEIGKQTILAGFNPEWKIEIGMVFSIVRNLEAKLKEKNNGT